MGGKWGRVNEMSKGSGLDQIEVMWVGIFPLEFFWAKMFHFTGSLLALRFIRLGWLIVAFVNS